MLASWLIMSKWKGRDTSTAFSLLRSLLYRTSFGFSGVVLGWSAGSVTGSWDDSGCGIGASSLFLRYGWPERVAAASGVATLAAKTSPSSSESVRELTSESGSMVEAMMTFACLVLPLDFLREAVVQGVTSSRRSGRIHIILPPGIVVRTSPFSCWRWGSELMTLIFTAGMGYTAVGVRGDWPKWMQDVMLAVAVFCSVFSFRAPASTSAYSLSFKDQQLLVGWPNARWYKH